jgi:thiamine biosynthesis lipoprotein
MNSTVKKYQHRAMSTIFELMVVEADEKLAYSAAHKIFERIDRLEMLLSRFLDVSEVALISRLKPGETFRVAPEMMELLLLSTQVCAVTSGVFDVTVGTVMDKLREVNHRWKGLTDDELNAAFATCGMNRLIIDKDNYLVAVTPDRNNEDTPLELDFGAIGKGYALDLACDMLIEDWDFKDFLIHGGTSSVLARGSMGDGQKGWPVGVGGDWKVRTGLDSLRLQDAAISGSGFDVNGLHIVDVRRGMAAVQHAGSWSYAPTAALADALSTAFLGMSWNEIKECCDKLPGCGALVARDQPLWMDKIRSPVQKFRFADI